MAEQRFKQARYRFNADDFMSYKYGVHHFDHDDEKNGTEVVEAPEMISVHDRSLYTRISCIMYQLPPVALHYQRFVGPGLYGWDGDLIALAVDCHDVSTEL
jgi:hypothetical protein